MEQLIFIGILVAFSVLDAIAKKKKKEAQAQLPHQPLPEEWQWEPPGENLQTYDADASYDDQADAPAGTGSQDLIPKDVWEEIAALAGGRVPPKMEPPPPAYPAPVPVDPRRPETLPDRPDHDVHLAHSKYGKPVSERLTALDMPEDHADRGASTEVRQAKRLLAGGGAALRQAVILQELLGPPVSLRED